MENPWHSVITKVVDLSGRPFPFEALRIESRAPKSDGTVNVSSIAQHSYVEDNFGVYRFHYKIKNNEAKIYVVIEWNGRQSSELIRPGVHEYNFRLNDEARSTSDQGSTSGYDNSEAEGVVYYDYAPSNTIPPADIGIITMKAEEFKSVIKRFPSYITHDGENVRYNYCSFVDNSGLKLTAAIVRSPQGDLSSLRIASELIREVRPKLILLVGIAGGRPATEFSLGDVLVANKAIDFTVSADDPKDGKQYVTRSHPLHPAVEKVVLNIYGDSKAYGDWFSPESIGLPKPSVDTSDRNFKGSDDWNSKIRKSLAKHFSDLTKGRNPLVFDAPIGSSSTLMKDSATFEDWIKSSRDVMAADMEIAGIFEACRNSKNIIPALVIRGVSDIIGFSRDDDWTEYACETSAAFTKALLNGGTLKIIRTK